MKNKDYIKDLFEFIDYSKTPYHAVDIISKKLEENGFIQLFENEKFNVNESGKYYVVRNSSSVIAFKIGDLSKYRFKITASHTDSPCFKIKANAEVKVKNKYMQLNTEGYGGMILAPWLDRPLSLAGRVIIRDGDGTREKLISVDRDLVIIPNLAIHMNRKINEGYAYNKQVDMLPLFGGNDAKDGAFLKLISEEAGVNEKDVLASDLFLYDRAGACYLGINNEFIGAPRLDDLDCAYSTLQGFIEADDSDGVDVFACFNNEEVGSITLQGAGSTFLSDVLRRINISLNKNEEDYLCALADSFMLSCDNAHAVHPNHPEKSDPTNDVYMNDGIVIKMNANQKYTSDADSIARFKLICEAAGIPYQMYTNRSDEAGGSTLGNIAMGNVSIKAVDIGLAQLAMHSAYETAGSKDPEYMVLAAKQFYES